MLVHMCKYVDQKAWLQCWATSGRQILHQSESEEYITQMTKHGSEESTLALKPRADVTRSSKQVYQWDHKKDLCPQILSYRTTIRRIVLQVTQL